MAAWGVVQLATIKSRLARNHDAASATSVHRPLHEVLEAAVELKFLEALPPLLDRLASAASYIFESDQLEPARDNVLADFVFAASKLPVRQAACSPASDARCLPQ